MTMRAASVFFLIAAFGFSLPAAAQGEIALELTRDQSRVEDTPRGHLGDQVLTLSKAIGAYRIGRFTGELSYETGDSNVAVIVPFPSGIEASRERIELRLNVEAGRWFRLSGGGRRDELTLTEPFVEGPLIDYSGNELFFGARFQTPARMVRFYAGAEYARGNGDALIAQSSSGPVDSERVIVELGLPITFGRGRWVLTPGFSFESHDAQVMTIESARLSFQTRYRFGR
jgi:hypothetical protein